VFWIKILGSGQCFKEEEGCAFLEGFSSSLTFVASTLIISKFDKKEVFTGPTQH